MILATICVAFAFQPLCALPPIGAIRIKCQTIHPDVALCLASYTNGNAKRWLVVRDTRGHMHAHRIGRQLR